MWAHTHAGASSPSAAPLILPHFPRFSSHRTSRLVSGSQSQGGFGLLRPRRPWGALEKPDWNMLCEPHGKDMMVSGDTVEHGLDHLYSSRVLFKKPKTDWYCVLFQSVSTESFRAGICFLAFKDKITTWHQLRFHFAVFYPCEWYKGFKQSSLHNHLLVAWDCDCGHVLIFTSYSNSSLSTAEVPKESDYRFASLSDISSSILSWSNDTDTAADSKCSQCDLCCDSCS